MFPFNNTPRFHRPMRRHQQNQDDHSHAEASTQTGNPAVNPTLPPFFFEGPTLPDEQRPPRPWTYHLNRALEDSLAEPLLTPADLGEELDDDPLLSDPAIDTSIVEFCPLCGAEDREVPIFMTTLPSVQEAVRHIAQENESVPYSVTIMECVSALFSIQAEFTELLRRYHHTLHENQNLLLQLRSIVGPNRTLSLSRHINHFIPLRRYLIVNEFERMVRRATAIRVARIHALQHLSQPRSYHHETVPQNSNSEPESSNADAEFDGIMRQAPHTETFLSIPPLTPKPPSGNPPPYDRIFVRCQEPLEPYQPHELYDVHARRGQLRTGTVQGPFYRGTPPFPGQEPIQAHSTRPDQARRVNLDRVRATGRRIQSMVRPRPRDPPRQHVDDPVDEDLKATMREHERNSRGKP
ncbi:uncharacterized protein N7483_002283 [Penicillium malachiteum]|uniref:uncharacterized protein n=1 Tax=Penicillium malachiteum TaxID=1324776 RepID=UPI002547DF7A|nr:uncharacterized protein N7483_002283 [Penicillium malachiteum]KAJ5737158.1 hypothetical protein N7483_002283 [Penicillium malachiteum]